MPSKNRVKTYAPEFAYHIYNRGNNKQTIFLDTEDYAVFLNILKRILGKKQVSDPKGRLYRNLHDELELLAFCLMPNHFHLLLYQHTSDAITKLMQSLITTYSMYFNKKYNHVGRVFQDTFKAQIVLEDSYWQHISRYIHLNPGNWRTWEWSSIKYYTGDKKADWVRPQRILGMFEGESYINFVADYEEHKVMLDELKHVVADL